MLGVTTRTVDRLIADHKLDIVHVGRRLIRIPLASIEAFLALDKAGA
jgi:excisionase family DNA binding protein